MSSPRKLKVSNLVLHTEQGPALTRKMLDELRRRDAVPVVPQERAHMIKVLLDKIAQADTLHDALRAIKASPYFHRYLKGRAILIEQDRNAIPSDVTIVYRHSNTDFQLESVFSVSHSDPIGPLVTSKDLLPATVDRTEDCLQRYGFGLHELAEPEELLAYHVYRSIHDDLRVAWHCIVLNRDAKFTWAMYIWYRVDEGEDLSRAAEEIRAGLHPLAPRLGQLFQRELKLSRGAGPFYCPNSLNRGMLVFDGEFKVLRRQNFAAEAMLQGMTHPEQIPVWRISIYKRIALEYKRRLREGAPTVWTVDAFFHPTTDPDNEVLRIEADPGRIDETVFSLTELHLPTLPTLKWWRLPLHPPSKLATTLRNLGDYLRGKTRTPPAVMVMSDGTVADACFIKEANCIARPVWDIDIVADRVQRYERISATLFARKWSELETAKEKPVWALLFRQRIVGVLQGV